MVARGRTSLAGPIANLTCPGSTMRRSSRPVYESRSVWTSNSTMALSPGCRLSRWKPMKFPVRPGHLRRGRWRRSWTTSSPAVAPVFVTVHLTWSCPAVSQTSGVTDRSV